VREASIAACLVAALAVGGCASSTTPLSDGDISSSANAHGSLTDHEFNVAVAIARAQADKGGATAGTTATATVGVGTVTDANVGPACTSGTLLHIKLTGTFTHIVTTGSPTDDASSEGTNYTVSAVLITADPASGKACLVSVQTGAVTPDPGATLLFTN
jgi:hypothetical protein